MVLLVDENASGTNPGCAFDDDVIALVEVGGGGNVGREFVRVATVGINDEGERDGDAHLVQRPCEDNGRSAAKALAEDNDARLSSLVPGELAVAVEVERAADQFCGEVELVIFNGFYVQAGPAQALAVNGGGADAADRIVPALPAAYDSQHQRVAGPDRQRDGEVVEGLREAVRAACGREDGGEGEHV